MMEIALKIEPCGWMRGAALGAIMNALGRDKALLVGGAVREVVLTGAGEAAPDIDVATVWRPEKVIELMAEQGIKTVPIGLEHGTVMAVHDGVQVEITTLRRDVKTDGRHAEVDFTQDWYADALRRDFTMNTLLMDLEGRVYDPTGRGVDDLLNGKVVFVGEADVRIAEDYLRILRFFRFHARYGKGAPDAVGLDSCVRARLHIVKLSRERIFQEYSKLLEAKNAGQVLELMREYEILPELISDNFSNSEYLILGEIVHKSKGISLNRLKFAYSVWWNRADFKYEVLDKYFVLSKVCKSYLKLLHQAVAYPADSYSKRAYLFGKDAALDAEVLLFIIKGKPEDVEGFLVRLFELEKSEIPVFPLSGKDVARITGLEAGVELGCILKRVESWWVEDGLRASRDDVLGRVLEFT